ncbi:helix-turn-helix transcriptional regulator [Virgibacillus senegalensis]|uniref:helix-turn-helix transcriptional regulator n=1 Tax=Virgibacillus senegalensis TaxID=1499679 RepID=UPI00069E1E85|nr:helix-turn-helix transcriptional regulator [Virgibacillus senegalensis]
MAQSPELLENLIQTYAFQSGLTIFLTDEQGERVLSPKGTNALIEILLQQDEAYFFQEVKKSMEVEWNISAPIFYDLIPGIHFLVLPVQNSEYFLWAGGMVEEQNRPYVEEQLGGIAQGINWEELLRQTPVLTRENRKEYLNWLNYLGQLTALCLNEKRKEDPLQLSSNLLHQISEEDKSDHSTVLAEFLNHTSDFDFLGVAEQQNDMYQVTHVTGQEAQSFKGANFSPGEGFLGRVALNGKYALLEKMDNDPRAVFFYRYSFRPKSMFCSPVKQRDGSMLLLFGGSFTSPIMSDGMERVSKMLAAFLEVRLLIHSLRLENAQQFNRLSSLVEVLQLMSVTPDFKRILYILVDISINLVEGPFSCVVLKDKDSKKIQLVSRGDFYGGLQTYAKNVSDRFLEYTEESILNQEPEVQQTIDGHKVIECPLFDGDQLFGVLCVGLPPETGRYLNEHLAFLQTLSIIGKVSIQLASQSNQHYDEDKVDLLQRATAQLDVEAYVVSRETELLATEFTTHLGVHAATSKEVIQACKLSFYDANFIRDTIPGLKAADSLEEGNACKENPPFNKKKEVKESSKIFALVRSYVDHGRNLDKLAPLKEIDEELHGKFVAFVKGRLITEQEITVEDLEEKQIGESAASAVRKHVNLSPREQEVLELVLGGLNNREIAEELYISEHTVKNHVTKIFQKLGVSDRPQAISKVYQLIYQ